MKPRRGLDTLTGATGGFDNTLPLARGVALPNRPGTAPLEYSDGTSCVEIIDHAEGTLWKGDQVHPFGTPSGESPTPENEAWGALEVGRLSKIGEELEWEYDWNHPLEPWRVRHRDGSLDLTLTPAHDGHHRLNALVLATEVHQVFGRWRGHVTANDGRRHEVEDILGFAEESRSRW